MRSEAVLPLLATVVSYEFAGALARRWWRNRRPYLRSWAISLGCYAAGCAALWYGTAFGWTPAAFRAYYLFGALLAVPWLAMGELELLMRPVRARVLLVFVVLLSVNAGFVVATVPFAEGAPELSGYALPHGKELLPALPRALLVVTNVLGTLVVVGGTLWSGIRSRRAGDPAARTRFRGTLLIALGTAMAAGSGLLTFAGEVGSVALALALGAGLMYAGFAVASRSPARHRAGRP